MESQDVAQPRRFNTTRWSVIRAAAGTPTAQSREALATLSQLYWYPVYAFVRREGSSAEDAHDLTQSFFVRLLEKNDLATVDPARGRFRAWLRACVRNFLANQRDHERAQKRGGGHEELSIDAVAAEQRYLLEPSHSLTPERLYERRWALTLLQRVLEKLRAAYLELDNEALFEALKGTLTGEPVQPYAELAGRLQMTEGAVKAAAFRLAKKYQQLLRAEVADTVDDPNDVEDEIEQLIKSL